MNKTLLVVTFPTALAASLSLLTPTSPQASEIRDAAASGDVRRVPALLEAGRTEPELPGRQLLDIPRLNAEIVAHHVPNRIQSMRDAQQAIDPEVDPLIESAQKALKEGDAYRCYRLLARAWGLVHGPAGALEHDVAAAFSVRPKRAVFWPGDTIDIDLEPVYDLGGPLPGTFEARLWLETDSGIVADTQRTVNIAAIARHRVSYSAASAPSGAVSCSRHATGLGHPG
jgi:hypothetical protein